MEERLIREVHAARRVYESATATYKQATWGRPRDNGLLLAAAGIPSVVEANKKQFEAFENYRRALKVFNDFVLNHELPEKELMKGPGA